MRSPQTRRGAHWCDEQWRLPRAMRRQRSRTFFVHLSARQASRRHSFSIPIQVAVHLCSQQAGFTDAPKRRDLIQPDASTPSIGKGCEYPICMEPVVASSLGAVNGAVCVPCDHTFCFACITQMVQTHLHPHLPHAPASCKAHLFLYLHCQQRRRDPRRKSPPPLTVQEQYKQRDRRTQQQPYYWQEPRLTKLATRQSSRLTQACNTDPAS